MSLRGTKQSLRQTVKETNGHFKTLIVEIDLQV
jgi:hypothetical protein